MLGLPVLELLIMGTFLKNPAQDQLLLVLDVYLGKMLNFLND